MDSNINHLVEQIVRSELRSMKRSANALDAQAIDTVLAMYDRSNGTEVVSYGPGPQELISGSFETVGYFGEVSCDDLFFGNELAGMLSLRKGMAINSNIGWLKFWDHGKIKYIAKKPFRHSISWDTINSVGAVNGVIISHDYEKFEVRLPTGSSSITDVDNEWDRLMVLAGEHFTDEELGIDYDCGCASWTQGFDGVVRGHGLLNYEASHIKSSIHPSVGWRPLLELQ